MEEKNGMLHHRRFHEKSFVSEYVDFGKYIDFFILFLNQDSVGWDVDGLLK